ncbi:MAG: ABC transporter substrate-binding protein, partial [Cyanobium sp.]
RLSFFSSQQQRLTPSAHYWGPQPANRGINLVTLGNSTALLGALRSGEVDVLLASGLEIDHQQALHRDAAAGRLREGSGPPLSIGFLSLLTDQPPLNSSTLREALARSLDRATISRRVSLGMRPPLRQLIPPSLMGSDPGAWPAYDPAAARSLFRKAGYCNGRVLSLPLTFRSDIPSDRLLALTWQAQVRRDLGDCLALQVSGMESTTAYDQLGKGALSLFFYDWIGDYPDAENFLVPLLGCSKEEGSRCAEGNSALSGSFWSAPGLEGELQRSSRLEGPARQQLLQAIQRRTAAAVPYLPVWLMAEQAWSGPRISPPRFEGSGRLRQDQLRLLPGDRAGSPHRADAPEGTAQGAVALGAAVALLIAAAEQGHQSGLGLGVVADRG